MKSLTRRTILRSMAAAPIGGHIAIEQAKMGLMRGGLFGAGISSDSAGDGGPNESKFTNFASWLTGGGEKEIRRNAEDINGFDADIIEMRSPSLSAKVRMQRKRNYIRLLDYKQGWFKEILARKGIVRDWF